MQGVGCRYFAVRTAQELGLRGFARNLAGGFVEVVAEGEEEQLRRLLEALRQGPVGARVDEVQVSWGEARHEFTTFTVKFTSY